VSGGGVSAEEVPTPEVPARNLILLIGDGMGPAHMGLLEHWARRGTTWPRPGQPTALSRLMADATVGLSLTHAAEAQVVDSACSATQLATGQPALSEVIGVDLEGQPLDTILLAAARSGRSTGLVTDTRLTHATPAAFAAHAGHRSEEEAIAPQLLAHEVDVLLSACGRHFLPAGADPEAVRARTGGAWTSTGGRRDGRNLLDEAAAAGWSVVYDRAGLESHREGRLLGCFADSAMTDGITESARRQDPARTEPTLREMTEAALRTLDANPRGFFLMVEGGQIDWAAHDNDAGRLLHELYRLDEALDAVLAFVAGRDDTVVVLTADHETGGLGVSYHGVDIPAPQALPGPAFAARGYAPQFNFGPFAVLDGLAAQSRTLASIFEEVRRTADAGGDPAAMLHALLQSHSAFPLASVEEAASVLAVVPNRMQVEGHPYLAGPSMPALCAYDAFYPYGLAGFITAVARRQADRTHVVWSTGTHTHTPVAVVAWGPEALVRAFGGLLHHVEVGQRLFGVLGLRPARLGE
jgi:alkaline phosphatase